MPLSQGSRLGPYEIQSALGAGGMGEVYKARDTRLDRTVAIKILHDMDLDFAPEQPAGSPPQLDRPSIFTAIQEQLGLKLAHPEALSMSS